MVNVSESRLGMNDGTELFIRDWLIEDNKEGGPSPCIVVMHGLGEHSGRYQHVAPFLNSCGFSVRTFDHRGHGQSNGPCADILNPLAIVRDAEFVIQNFAERCHTLPILLGHSMGGLFAARIATAGKVPLQGLILVSPALALRLSQIDRFFLRMMSVLAPHLAISNGLNSAHLSHDPTVKTAYDNDPLVHKKVTASLLNSMQHAIDYVQTHAPLLTIPTLLLVAEDDRIVDSQGSHDFFDSLPSNVGTAHFYSGFYHEILNEIEAATVFKDLQSWLSARNFIT